MPGEEPRLVPLHGSCYRIGRGTGSDVVIEHGAVSRRHALLEQRGQNWLLSDCDSTNGLWWQGRRVQQLLLRDGDGVRFGPNQEGGLPEVTFESPRWPGQNRWRRWGAASLAGGALAGVLLLTLSGLQVPIRGSLAPIRGPLVLYDRENRPIASAEDQHHRELGSLGQFSPVLIQALLASEDSRFWWHPGVDPIGTGRALVTNLVGGRVLEGGSTLTQQLARSLYPDQVGQGETLARKWRELLVALQLEARFSKAELLRSYLNRVYLGVGWGFEDAARRYFDRPASRLNLEQAALLVGLLPSPNGYDPCLDPQAALAARNGVLAKMESTGRISSDQAHRARRAPIELAANACRSSARHVAPFYSDQVRRDLENLVGADVAGEGNYLIDTHLDPAVQSLVERLLRQKLQASSGLGVSEGAVVVLDSRTSGILAIAGGRDYRQSQFNRATMAQRQPGSTFKLIPYVVAIEQGARAGDSIACGPLRWQGQFFDSACGGMISLRQALAISSNTAALRLARRVGLTALTQKARDLGITSPLEPVPGLALGQSEVTLLELTAAYGAVANDGIWHAPSTIRKLTDAERCHGGDKESGSGIEAKRRQGSSAAQTGEPPCRGGRDTPNFHNVGRRAMAASTAATMQELLLGVVSNGTGTAAYVGGRAGGKTGTTNDGRDLLFVGYEPTRHWVMGVWMGNDDNRPSRATSALAASLWGEIIRTAAAP
ncbi:MAG: transglycosylase domain-containing protein [Cyanobacteria bacterium]|nr:transglycosylase domain-containing protein [Cyanobacteriota bacterium]